MVTGVACGLQNRCGALARLGWVRFPHVPAILGWIVCLSLGTGDLRGQDPPADTVRVVEAVPATDLVAVRDTVPPITPLGAMARSMVLPGWGQLEVGRPGRAAFYFAAETTFLFMVFKSQGKLAAARDANPQNDDLVSARTRQRENWLVLAGFIAFLSGVDAWVSTHFWDFEPGIVLPADGAPGIALAFKVNLP